MFSRLVSLSSPSIVSSLILHARLRRRSASVSASMSACHARGLPLVEHAPADRPGPLLDSGTVVHVTNNQARCEEQTRVPVPLEGVGGSTAAWITKCFVVYTYG
jgi:hypothetical protein